MGNRNGLDDFGEIYPGFNRDRDFIKTALPDPYQTWNKVFVIASRIDYIVKENKPREYIAYKAMFMIKASLGRSDGAPAAEAA